MKNGVMYMNTAMEEWEDSENPNSFPKTTEELYKTSLAYRHDMAQSQEYWNANQGTTSVFEHGMNPGLISHFAKKGLLDAARFFLTKRNEEELKDLDFDLIEKVSKEKNYPKLAQALGLHTIHCSEVDNQWVKEPPSDLKKKFYNTWSCRGFLTEGLVPLQVAKGSHEDNYSEEFPRVRENTCIMSWGPSKNYKAKSWNPFGDIEGVLIPHGEAFTINEFFSDKETGYSPSQYYVYDINPYAREFIENLLEDTTLQDCNPDMEVLHPINHELHGYDRVGAMLIFNKNRGWWSGTVMDEFDASFHMDYKYGPTVLQVAGGVFSCFLWMCNNPNVGNKWAEQLDTDFILEISNPYLGRVYSQYVDVKNTHLKDCHKFESFLIKKADYRKKK
jgi:homospermidine synthase